MSYIPVLQYLLGIGVFGFIYYIMDGLLGYFVDAGVSETSNTYTLLFLLWTGILIIYLVFGGIWVIRKYNEKEYRGGMF